MHTKLITMIGVSVILVTYNSEDTIQRTLDSVINQTGRGKCFNLELVVTDICSSDNIQEIFRKNNISFIETTRNASLNKGRNLALKRISGDYFCFIDQNDVWQPDKIYHQLMATQYASIISTGYSITNASGKTGTAVKSGKGIVLFGKNETFRSKLKKEPGGQNTLLSTLMISSKFKDYCFEEKYGHYDYDWQLQVMENQRTAEIPMVLNRRYTTGYSFSQNHYLIESDILYTLSVLEHYKNKYAKEVRQGIHRTKGNRYYNFLDKIHSLINDFHF